MSYWLIWEMRLRLDRRGLICSHLYFQCSPHPSPHLLWPELVKQCQSGLWFLRCPNTVHSLHRNQMIWTFLPDHITHLLKASSHFLTRRMKMDSGHSLKMAPCERHPPPPVTPAHSLCSNHMASVYSSNTPHPRPWPYPLPGKPIPSLSAELSALRSNFISEQGVLTTSSK